MKIRDAQQKDVEAIAEIGNVSFCKSFGHLYPEEVLQRYLQATYSIEKITSSLIKESNKYFVAEHNNRITGFLKLKHNSFHELINGEKQIQLQKIYLSPESTGSGTGSLLMKAAEKYLADFLPVIVWLMVYEQNHRAIKFYQRLGYANIGHAVYDFENTPVNFNVMKFSV